MSDKFIEHCLWTIGQVLEGYGKSLSTAEVTSGLEAYGI